MDKDLETYWLKSWENIGAKGDPTIFYNVLTALYSQSHRFYHTLAHIRSCFIELSEFTKACSTSANPWALRSTGWALWLHDAIYETDLVHQRNEEKSAELSEIVMRWAGVSEELNVKVKRAIIATKHVSFSENLSGVSTLVCDIDLSSLGVPWEVFEHNGQKIRNEYQHIVDDSFFTERKRILESFLKRKNIYYTDYFRDKYEVQARQNLTWSVEQLSGQLKH